MAAAAELTCQGLVHDKCTRTAARLARAHALGRFPAHHAITLCCGAVPCMQAAQGAEVSAADFAAAEPDVLRKSAAELVQLWNR